MSLRDATGASPVFQMRLVVEAEDYEEAVRFYRDVLDCLSRRRSRARAVHGSPS